MLAYSEPTLPGTEAPAFELPDASGTLFSLEQCKGEKGTVVAFICNHCPYVIAIADRISAASRDLSAVGVTMVGIMSNDWRAYPQDAPSRMGDFARRYGFDFPYLVDESQEIAKAYGTICTPDFFGFDAELKLVYRGRLDASGRQSGPLDSERELVNSMSAIARGEPALPHQHPSQGCSIKWKA